MCCALQAMLQTCCQQSMHLLYACKPWCAFTLKCKLCLQVSTNMTVTLPCEDAARIGSKLEAQADLGPMRMLYDIAEIVDACGGSHMEVHLDCRQHRNESLLLPSLAPFTGPALCVKLPGVPLSLVTTSA